jgi:crossover junction endodeoxyribonuclease RuvC
LLILGIDPGYGRCGWGVIEQLGNRLLPKDCGVIETKAGEALSRRLVVLRCALSSLLLKFKPDETAVEQLYFSKNAKTAMDVGQARGVVMLTCAEGGRDVAEYKPAEIKLAVTGYGAASKEQVQKMVKVLLGLHNEPLRDDAADALAVAICHAHSRLGRLAATRTVTP